MKVKEGQKKIAFAVHEDKNTELIEWSYFNKEILNGHKIIACGKAGNILEGTLNIPVIKLPEGAPTGCHSLTSYITEGKVDILIFFWNDTKERFHHNSMQSLLSAALEANVVVIHNKVSAEYILSSALMNN